MHAVKGICILSWTKWKCGIVGMTVGRKFELLKAETHQINVISRCESDIRAQRVRVHYTDKPTEYFRWLRIHRDRLSC